MPDTPSDLRGYSREPDVGVSPNRTRGGYATPEGRRRNMAAIRRSDTKPEIAVRSTLHRRGHRFRKDLRLDLQGGVRPRPDVVFTRARLAVFIDGCFWHSCPDHGSQPRVNTDYWGRKLQSNVERDRRHDLALVSAGWRVIRVWEHEPIADVVQRIEEALADLRSPQTREIE